MKKYALIFMICILIMNMTSCKRMPEDTAGADIPAQGTQAEPPESEKQQKPEEQPINPDAENKDNKDIAEDKPDGTTDKTNDADKENTEPTEEYKTFVDQEDDKIISENPILLEDNSEQKFYCGATVADKFNIGEVIVVLSKKQSAAKQEYVPEDFPDINVTEVEILYDYYPADDTNMILLLKIDGSQKQDVIDAISVLEQDNRVISAEPNYICTVVMN